MVRGAPEQPHNTLISSGTHHGQSCFDKSLAPYRCMVPPNVIRSSRQSQETEQPMIQTIRPPWSAHRADRNFFNHTSFVYGQTQTETVRQRQTEDRQTELPTETDRQKKTDGQKRQTGSVRDRDSNRLKFLEDTSYIEDSHTDGQT